jgi:hypothetical protein
MLPPNPPRVFNEACKIIIKAEVIESNPWRVYYRKFALNKKKTHTI